MDDVKQLIKFLVNKITVSIVVLFLSINALSETYQLGDLAPRGAPDGILNAADYIVLQQILLGDIIPTSEEQMIGDVAPLGAPDNLLNAGDLVIQSQAIVGDISLGTIDITPLPAPEITTKGKGGSVITTEDNPYLVTGKASRGALVEIYVNGVFQKRAWADSTKGTFSVEVYLFDGISDIYAVEVEGLNISPPSNLVQVQYENSIDKSNPPTTISVNTVWTVGATTDPYIISSNLVIESGVSLVLQPGVSIVFDGEYSKLDVKGSLIIKGTSDNKILLTESVQNPGLGWNGIYVDGYAEIDHAIIEYANNFSTYDANSGVYFSSRGRGSVSNTLIQYCYHGIEIEGSTSPTIGPNNIITENENGLYVTDANNRSLYHQGDPKPVIFGNKIFENTSLNIFVDADYIDEGGKPINARGNYWGGTNLSDFTEKMLHISHIDFGGYLDADGNVVSTETLLQGVLSSNTALDENTVYDVLGVFEIPANITLTVPKGATLRFAKSSGMNVYGSLVTAGTELEPVTLTTGKSEKTKGSWGSITIKDGGYVSVDYSVIEYGHNNLSFSDGSDGIVSNSIIRNSSNIGISIYGVSPTITNNIITQNGRFVGGGIIFQSGNATTKPIIKHNQIFDNRIPVDFYWSFDNEYNEHNALLDMRENYWGSTDINEIYMNECGGGGYSSYGPCLDYRDYLDENGDIVEINSLLGVLSENVTLLPNTTYEVLSYFEIPEGITLTIPAGVKLNFYNKSQDMVVLGELISSGIPTNPVVFTSGKTDPAQRDWSGIDVHLNGSLSMEYTVVQYADRAVSFSGSNVGGNITNSIIEESNIGLEDYSDASNVNISNTLFRLNYTGIDVPGPSSPFIGPANTIKENRYGIYLRQKSNLNPSPSIVGNYIFNNTVYNINVNNFIGGNTITVDARGNYWGTDDPVKIASKMNQTSSSFPIIDFSDYILKADVPPNTGSNIVGQELLLCPVVHKLDDTDFVDNVPDENIEWIGSNYSDVNEIEKAFNNARAIDSSIFKYLKMPIQESWEGMSVQEQGLYLINAERQARGLKPYEGLSQNVTVIIQDYTDYIRENNQVIGHYNDGKTSAQRLDENSIILENRDANVKLENGFATYWGAPVLSDSEAIVMAVYYWIYYDMFPLVGDAWGHRGSILQTGLYENSGETYKEGLIGFGVSSGEYNPGSANSVPNGTVVFVNIIDPSSTWDHSTTLAVDTDSAQLCNDNIVITIDETSVSDVSRVISLEISPSDILLSPGGTEQLKIVANFEAPLRQKDVTSIANFNADTFSVVNIEAGYITALKNGDIHAIATVNGVMSNSILISVRDKTDINDFDNTEAKNYLTHLPDNASIAQYDTNAFGVFTGYVDDKYDRPLNDVIVSVFNKPEYGSVKTDINGRFNFATNAGERTFVYRKSGHLTVHRSAVVASNAWAVVDDVTLLKVDSKESAINLTASTPQIHKSTEITDTFGTRSTTLVFNGVTSATVTSTNGSQRSIENFLVRATEYELPKSMPAELPKESAFTYCSELQVAGVRDDETVTFDNDVVMYVDNFLGFNVGEIVPIGYYDRQLGDWVASDNGIVVKLLDSDSDGLVDGLDMSGDDVADDLNGNGSTEDEVAGIESYTPEATYWRGAFNHFTPYDFNWPFVPPLDATNPGDVKAETSNNDKDKNECTRIGSYVKPETQSFHEDIPITGTDLALHYSMSENIWL